MDSQIRKKTMGYPNNTKKRATTLLRTTGGMHGFTLIELLVGIAVGGIVAAAIMGAYVTSAKQLTQQRSVAMMHMNQRGSIEDMETQFRMAGYDPLAPMARNIFGITDVRRYAVEDEVTSPALSAAGSPSLTLIYDNYEMPGGADGNLDVNDAFISYRLMDETSDGIFELARDTAPGDGGGIAVPREILAENIHAIGFAYAIDSNGDGEMDRSPKGNIIWAVDSNNDNVLDANLDANGDGSITLADDTDGNFIIDTADQTPQGAIVGTFPLTAIRSIRVWILARADKRTQGFINRDTYLVGDRILSAANGDFSEELKCRLLERTIQCRNMGP
jgi:type IV pilus assembly protein PilW